MVEPVSRRRALGLGLCAAALAGCAEPGRPSPSPPASTRVEAPPSPRPGSAAVEVVRAETGRPQVALTFHGAGIWRWRAGAGPVAAARRRVTVLAVTTTYVADLSRELPVTGRACHGNYPRQVGQRCRDKLVELTGLPGAFFRPSQGQHATLAELEQAGRAGYARVLSYDVDSLDWRDPGPAAIRSAVAGARAGSVVSMHLGHRGTLAALPGILDDLAARGLTPVTATELLR